jgi:hypothetical protein
MSFINRQCTLEKLNFLPFRSKFNPSRRLDLITSSVGVAREMSRKQNKCKERIQFILWDFSYLTGHDVLLLQIQIYCGEASRTTCIKIHGVQNYSSFYFDKVHYKPVGDKSYRSYLCQDVISHKNFNWNIFEKVDNAQSQNHVNYLLHYTDLNRSYVRLKKTTVDSARKHIIEVFSLVSEIKADGLRDINSPICPHLSTSAKMRRVRFHQQWRLEEIFQPLQTAQRALILYVKM